MPGGSPPSACNGAGLDSATGSPGAVIWLAPEPAAALAFTAGAPLKLPLGGLAETPLSVAAAVPRSGAVGGDVADGALRLGGRRAKLAAARAVAFLSAAPRVSTGSPDTALTAFSWA